MGRVAPPNTDPNRTHPCWVVSSRRGPGCRVIRTAPRFPRYVRFAPEEVARDFCRVYVAQRGVERDHGREFIQIAATRSEAFREDLLAQLRRVVDDPDAVRGDSWPVRVYEPAKSQLAGYPEID
jgi:hypothetical protein